MTPEPRMVPRFAAEPTQDLLPYGRWGERLAGELLAACLQIDQSESGEIGEVGEILWYPDRTWHGRTFQPATATTTTGLEIFGYVSYIRGDAEQGEPTGFDARADATSETADRHPEWRIDLCDEVVGSWRGEAGNVAAMTLVWGRPIVTGAVIATAELASLCVDQCVIAEGRFTLIAPDDYRGDTLEVAVFDRKSAELARESLYAEDDEVEDEQLGDQREDS